ncbi:MAG: hypothetical protein WAO52_07795 [Prolixibacteraceae bacterium]
MNLAENRNEQLFALFYNHIGILKPNSNHEIEILPFKFASGENLEAVTFDNANQLWIGTSHGAIYRSSPPYQTMELF